jgi:hypothetical protein
MPSISSSPADRAEVGKSYSYALLANESVSVTYSGPSWLTWDPDERTLTGTVPTAPQTGHASLRIVSTAGTLTVWQNWTVEVWANPPVIVDPPDTTAQPSGDHYSYSFGGSGWGSSEAPGPLRLTVNSTADWVRYDTYNGTIYGQPYVPGSYVINASVTNTTTGLSTWTNYTVTVEADPPQAITDDHTEVSEENGQITITDRVWTGYLYSYTLAVMPDRCTITATTDAEWLTWTAENGTVWGTPMLPGTWHVNATVYDPLTTLTSWSNWTIEVSAPPPVISTDASWTVLTNAPWDYTLVYSPVDGLVEIRTDADWMQYDQETHLFSGTPDRAGSYYVLVTVTNRTSGMEAVQNITISVVDNPPVLVCNPLRTGMERTLYRWTASADQKVIWTMDTDADWLTIGLESGRIGGTPSQAGTYAVTITATNERGISASYSYNLTISPYKADSSDNGNGGIVNNGTITLPGGIEIPIGGTASYSTSITGPVIGFVAVMVIILFIVLFRRRDKKR